ncbi:hypothetical protein B7P43_G15295 [Cryptotermes secundus]|uniref:PiggyBac transposable element-derived protein 4 C-terminal zinc-finger domain-containing protein n=1 Tax=Cryptotermes secundus TaxID=105785 RepID=A0A2J7QNY0_9NEOP|nr:hypothetical protein B7P43_G15295 [Cryptotermes secundus]
MPCEHIPHQYGTTTSLHGALLTTGVHGLMGSAPNLNPTICLKQLQGPIRDVTSPELKYKAFLLNVAKAWATDQMVAAEPAADTGLVRPGPSTPTPRRPHVKPPGRLSGDMRKHILMKIVKSEHAKGKQPSRRCRVCTVHNKRNMTVYMCKFCVMPLHKGECFQKYHTLKHF